MALSLKKLKDIENIFAESKSFRDDNDTYLNLKMVLFHKTHFKFAEESIASLKQLNRLIDKIFECQNRPSKAGLDKVMRDFKRQYQLHKDFIINHQIVIEILFRIIFKNRDSISKNLENILNLYTIEDYKVIKILNRYRNIIAHSSGENFLIRTSSDFCGGIMVQLLEMNIIFLKNFITKHSEELNEEYQRLDKIYAKMNFLNMSMKAKNEG